MSDVKKFKNKVIGYSKKDVYDYISEIDSSHSSSISQLKKENEDLKFKLNMLEKENKELKEKGDIITDAIVKAQGYSKDIIEKANSAASEIRADIEKDMLIERQKLESYKAEVSKIKNDIKDILSKFDDDLEKINMDI